MKHIILFLFFVVALFSATPNALDSPNEEESNDAVNCYGYIGCSNCVADPSCFYCAINNGMGGTSGRCLPLEETKLCPVGAGVSLNLPQCGCLNNTNCTSCASDSGCAWCETTLTCGGSTMATCSTPC